MKRDCDDKLDIVAEFKKRRRRQLIAVLPFLVAAFAMFMIPGEDADQLHGLATIVMVCICIAVMIAVAVFWWFNWRCPACKSYLGKSMNPIFCQTCGAKLQG